MTLAKDPVEVLQVKKLIHCVRIEDYNQIRKLCEKGVELLINYNEPKEGLTALILAAVKNNEKMMEFLLEMGAHPNVHDFKGKTALMAAAELGNVQVMEILKKAKADATLKDFDGKDVLFYCLLAPTNRHQACMQIVLTMQPNCNNKSKDGTPVFVEACKEANERKDMCLLLIQNGADPSAFEEKSYRTALHYAASCGSIEVCRSILRHGGNANALDINKITPAHEAAAKGHFSILLLLSSFGAHFDVYDTKGNNPIHFAAACNAGQCCRFLATRGCNPKSKNSDGQTAKSIAKEGKCKDASKMLRKAEKQYSKLSRQTMQSGGVNWSIRLYDYMYEHKDRMRELFAEHDPEQTGKISKDAFIQIITQEGFQNLVQTEEMNKLTMSHEKVKDQIDYDLFLLGKKYINKQFLISSFESKKKKKKSKKAKARRGKTKIVIPICTLDEGPRMEDGCPPPVYQPRHIHFTDTARFDRDTPPAHPLQDDSAWYLRTPECEYEHIAHAASRGDCKTLLDAFKRGLPVDVRDKYFKTPLMIAAGNGDLDTCRFLLQCGADVNAFDNFKWTALHHACNAAHLDIVKLLVEKGANINALSITQATPLMRAVESSSFPVVEYLIEKGAKIIQETINGKTVFDLAKEFADPRVYLRVKNKFDALPKPKDGKRANAKKKPEKKKKASDNKGKGEPSTYKDDFLPPITMRRLSYSAAESMLVANHDTYSKKVTFRPIHVWTEQDTTEKLLEKKEVIRDRFGWEIDFDDYKIPFLKNVMKKIDKLET